MKSRQVRLALRHRCLATVWETQAGNFVLAVQSEEAQALQAEAQAAQAEGWVYYAKYKTLHEVAEDPQLDGWQELGKWLTQVEIERANSTSAETWIE